MLTRLAFSFALFVSVGLIPGGVSAAVMYTFGGPNSSDVPIVVGDAANPSSDTIEINLDGVGVAEVNFFIDVNAGGALTFQLSQNGSVGLKVAEIPSDGSFIGSNFFDGPVPTAQRIETVLGITSGLTFDDDRGVLASNALFLNESDGQWSNGNTSSPVSGFVAMTFERTVDGTTSTHLGFIEVEVNEADSIASIISVGFDDQVVSSVPEPSSSLLLLLSGSLLVLRRR